MCGICSFAYSYPSVNENFTGVGHSCVTHGCSPAFKHLPCLSLLTGLLITLALCLLISVPGHQVKQTVEINQSLGWLVCLWACARGSQFFAMFVHPSVASAADWTASQHSRCLSPTSSFFLLLKKHSPPGLSCT